MKSGGEKTKDVKKEEEGWKETERKETEWKEVEWEADRKRC